MLGRVATLLLLLLLMTGPPLAAAASAAEAAGDEQAADGSGDVVEDQPGPLTERLAALTQGIAEDLVSQTAAAAQALDPRTATVNWDGVAATLNVIFWVVLPTVALFLVLRWLERPLFRRAGAWAGQVAGAAGLWRRAVAIGGSAVSDYLVILLAWVLGYVLALFVLGEHGVMDPRQSLFLNAFLGLEGLKATFRVLFAPRYHALRLLSLDDAVSAYWNAWLARLTDFVGYGLIIVVPIIGNDISPALGSIVAFVVLATALLYAITIIRQNREPISERFQQAAADSRVAFNRFALALLARSWHWLAIAYLVALAFVIQFRPAEALLVMGQATLQSVVVLGLGVAGFLALSGIIGRPVRVPAATRERLPDLEERLNLFVPASIHVLRIIVVVAVLVGLLDAWRLFDVFTWIASDGGMRFLATLVSVVIIVVIACAVWVLSASWVDSRLQVDGATGEDIGARKRTLLTLFRSALAIALAIMTLMIVLSEIGINIAPLIAGAGVLGLAIGFGAQKLVQDIITGVFIQLENAINTGDFITVGGLSGTVERLSIRSVGIRDLEGTVHILPFSSVDIVSNYMRDFAYHLGVYGVAYRENTDDVITHLRAAFDELMEDEAVAPHVIDELEVNGVTKFADSAVNIRVRIKTEPGMQWFVGRAYNRLVKQHFDAAGVEIPFPHQTLYFGQGKEGTAPPAFVRMLDQAGEAGDYTRDRLVAGQSNKTDDPAHDDGRELPPEFGDVERDAESGEARQTGDPGDNDTTSDHKER